MQGGHILGVDSKFRGITIAIIASLSKCCKGMSETHKVCMINRRNKLEDTDVMDRNEMYRHMQV